MEAYTATIVTSFNHGQTHAIDAIIKQYDSEIIEVWSSPDGNVRKYHIDFEQSIIELIVTGIIEGDELILTIETSLLCNHSVIAVLASIAKQILDLGFDVEVGARWKIDGIEPRSANTYNRVSSFFLSAFEEFDRVETDVVKKCLPQETSRWVDKIKRYRGFPRLIQKLLRTLN